MAEQNVQKILFESLPVLFTILVFALAAGQLLEGALGAITPIFPLILLMVPAFNNISGDLAGVVGARITSHLYTGELDYGFRPYRLLFTNLIAVLLVAATAYAVLATGVIIISFFLGLIRPLIYFVLLFFTIFGTGVFVTTLTSFIGLFSARVVYQFGHDPDSVIAPITTTLSDLFGILFMTLTLLAVGQLPFV